MQTIGYFLLENDVDFKCIPDGYEIFADAVQREQMSPDDFESAHYEGCNIIVNKE